MASLLFSDKEKCVVYKFIDEAFRLYGIDATLFDLNSTTAYLDDRTLKLGMPYKILLQEYVDTRLLSNLKWSTVDADKESFIALMPIVYNGTKYNLRALNVIKLFNGDTYQIREVNSAYLLSTIYVVKLISYRDEKNRPREEKQMKTNFLKTDRMELE